MKRRPGEKLPETKSASTQVEMDEFLVLRRLNLEIQGFPESYTTEPIMVDVGTEVHHHHPPPPPPPPPVPVVEQVAPPPPPSSTIQQSPQGGLPPLKLSLSTSPIPQQSVQKTQPHMAMHDNSMISTSVTGSTTKSASNNTNTNNKTNDINTPPPVTSTDSRLSDIERTINETISNDLGMTDINASYNSKETMM